MEKLTKYILILAGITIVSFFAHNFWYVLFGREDAVFFILTILGFVALVVLSIVAGYSVIRTNTPKDAWMVGFVGVALEIIVIALGFNRVIFYIIPVPFILFFLQFLRT